MFCITSNIPQILLYILSSCLKFRLVVKIDFEKKFTNCSLYLNL